MSSISDYDYLLPEQLIAQHPPEIRGMSRLLVAHGTEIADREFIDLIDELVPGDLVVLNNTRVIPARIFARKESGGAVEILFERALSQTCFLAQAKANRPLKIGQVIILDDQPRFFLKERADTFFIFETCNHEEIFPLLETYGHMPLPPYIERGDSEDDQQRYQTVFSKEKGAVAAPTAGLHFTVALMEALKKKGVHFAELTLHVGAGTFQPVREDLLVNHIMHKEWISVPEETVAQVKLARSRGGRVIAVGTTVARALETAALSGEIMPYEGETQIFIQPGFKFHVINGLITNFHLPKSTLLVLVSTFMGYQRIKKIYAHAIAEQYRFFSYGDAMLLLP